MRTSLVKQCLAGLGGQELSRGTCDEARVFYIFFLNDAFSLFFSFLSFLAE